MNQVIGNWQFAGLFRWTSGFPFNIITFGRYNSVLGTCDGRAGRCKQASLKYEF